MGHNLSTYFRRAVGVFLILGFLIFIAEASDSSTVNYATNQSITAFSTCKKVTNNSGTGKDVYVPTQSAAEWASFYGNPPVGVTIGSCSIDVVPLGQTTATNVNLCTLAGNPTTPGTYVFTIAAGSIVNSNSTSQPALITGTCWPAGSTITLINNGSIYGRGGDGGAGSNKSGRPCFGSPGLSGGAAIGMTYPMTIDNTNGQVFGGGGGGGGGYQSTIKSSCVGLGGGGGGGQGSVNSAGGWPNGGGGTSSGPGGGGQACTSTYCTALLTGGTGGAWGQSGSHSNGATNATGDVPGGAGGPAVTGASYGVTWLGGYNGSQVRGAVQ